VRYINETNNNNSVPNAKIWHGAWQKALLTPQALAFFYFFFIELGEIKCEKQGGI